MDKDYPLPKDKEKELYSSYINIEQFLKEYSQKFKFSNNSNLNKDYYIVDLYSSIYDINNKIKLNSPDSTSFNMVLPKFIRVNF